MTGLVLWLVFSAAMIFLGYRVIAKAVEVEEDSPSGRPEEDYPETF